MVLFAAIYIYFLIQMVMASLKWKDSLTFEEMKNKLNIVPSIVEKWTKTVKNKISDGSVIVIEKAKDLTQKAWETFKEWKDYVVDKCKNLKNRLGSTNTRTSKTESKSKKGEISEKAVYELIKANKELIDITKKLVDKYEKSMKLLEQINKNLPKKE